LGRTEQEFIASYLSDSSAVLKAYAADTAARSTLIRFADIITAALAGRNKLMIAGNGGSAADAQQVLGLGNPGDVFLGISTSGKSPNILLALDAAKANGIITLGFTGAHATAMNEKCDMVLAAPSTMTSIIQQVHIVAAHIICGLVERRFVLFASQAKPQ
jgi:D-sedoheptulose 7-phosphate isomerase